MIQKVKKVKPDGKYIAELRESKNLSQDKFLKELKRKLGHGMSKRTYQRIERGDNTQPLYIQHIHKFYYALNSISKKTKEKITVDDLLIFPKEKKKNYDSNKKKNLKPATFERQLTYLYAVNHFDDIAKLISKSHRRKFFYPLTIDSRGAPNEYDPGWDEQSATESIVKQIDDYGKKRADIKYNSRTENYGNADLEVNEINQITKFGNCLNYLNNRPNKINLYAGNVTLQRLTTMPVDPHPFSDILKYGVGEIVITVLCFKRDEASDLNFNYMNYFHKEKLNFLLKEKKMDKYEGDSDYFEKQEYDIQAFEDEIKYFQGIDASKVTFDHYVPYTAEDLGDEKDWTDMESNYPEVMDDDALYDEYKDEKAVRAVQAWKAEGEKGTFSEFVEKNKDKLKKEEETFEEFMERKKDKKF